jgi:hypothetical protein
MGINERAASWFSKSESLHASLKSDLNPTTLSFIHDIIVISNFSDAKPKFKKERSFKYCPGDL